MSEMTLSADTSRGTWMEVVRDHPGQSLDDLADIAAAKFERKYGYPPEHIHEDDRHHLWLGPVKTGGHNEH